jgi:hypothetical protein
MRALTRITTQVKTYLPGEVLGKELTPKDIERLVKKKAVENSDEGEDELFGSKKPPVFLTEKELNKLSSKAKLIDYAQSIGLEGLTDKDSKNQLIDSIKNYIEELEDSNEDQNEDEDPDDGNDE